MSGLSSMPMVIYGLGSTGLDMPIEVKIRPFSGAASRVVSIAVLALVAGALFAFPAATQPGEPIKIGYSMALTGGLAPSAAVI
jgi:hypothetical protein